MIRSVHSCGTLDSSYIGNVGNNLPLCALNTFLLFVYREEEESIQKLDMCALVNVQLPLKMFYLLAHFG